MTLGALIFLILLFWAVTDTAKTIKRNSPKNKENK